MDILEQRFGDDLRLLSDLTSANDRERGEDLAVIRRETSGKTDLEPLSGTDNLKQALLLRFLTQVGELAPLGHRDYGSRLHELIGEPNTESNRNRAKLYVLRALAAEPRVEKVLAVDVRSRRGAPNRLDIDVSLKVLDSDTVLNLVFPFFLDQGVSP
jgi:phage baseplate assembly protein W